MFQAVVYSFEVCDSQLSKDIIRVSGPKDFINYEAKIHKVAPKSFDESLGTTKN